jgi:hypothetical protein
MEYQKHCLLRWPELWKTLQKDIYDGLQRLETLPRLDIQYSLRPFLY